MNEYLLLGIVSACVCLLMAVMFMSSRYHYLIKTTAAFLVVVAAIYNWELFIAVLGYPIQERPPDKSVILYSVVKKDQGAIYVVVNGTIPRTYTIPYSEPFQDKLEKAKKELDPRTGQLVYRMKPMKIKGGISQNTQGKNQQGNESKNNERKEGSGNNNNESDSLLTIVKEKAKDIVKKAKTSLNISEDANFTDDEIDSKDPTKKAKGAKDSSTRMENDSTIPDDLEIDSILPRKD